VFKIDSNLLSGSIVFMNVLFPLTLINFSIAAFDSVMISCPRALIYSAVWFHLKPSGYLSVSFIKLSVKDKVKTAVSNSAY